MLRFSRDTSSTNVSLRLRLRSLRPESVLYSTQLVGSQSVNPFVRCLQLIHRDSLMSGIFLKYYFFKFSMVSSHFKWGGSYTLSPAGRTAYVLSLPKHVQNGAESDEDFSLPSAAKKVPSVRFYWERHCRHYSQFVPSARASCCHDLRLQYSRQIVLEQCRVVWANFSAGRTLRKWDFNLLNFVNNILSSDRDNSLSYFLERATFPSLEQKSVLFSMRLVAARSVEPFGRNPWVTHCHPLIFCWTSRLCSGSLAITPWVVFSSERY